MLHHVPDVSIKAPDARPDAFEFTRRALRSRSSASGAWNFELVNPVQQDLLLRRKRSLASSSIFLPRNRKNSTGHMANTSGTSVTIYIRTWSFMILFCFAGCAAGSCLSYGHSCWGGHGKRSGGHNANNAYYVTTKTMSDVQQDVPSFPKEQWVLSRLIARPVMSTKYRGRWDRPFKVKTHLPQHWENSELNAHMISDEPIRDQNNNDDTDQGKKRNMKDIQDIIGNINDERKEMPGILLISNNGDDEQGSKPQNVELFKFLSETNDNFK